MLPFITRDYPGPKRPDRFWHVSFISSFFKNRFYCNVLSFFSPGIAVLIASCILMAAEAAFKGGATLQHAADMINVLRTRAALKANQTPVQYNAALAAQLITAAHITLDFILDERSRELFGRDTRWWDLRRTQKLVQRVQLYNAEVGAGVQSYNMLRSTPQSQIDLVTEWPKYPQNPGYQYFSFIKLKCTLWQELFCDPGG